MRSCVVIAAIVVVLAAPAPTSSRGGRSARVHSLDWAYALAIQPDGKIVAAGRSARRGWHFAIARYAKTGSLDRTFGRGGEVLSDVGTSGSFIAALTLERNGKLVAAGRAGVSPTVFATARYTPRGQLDASFGTRGATLTPFAAARKRIYAQAAAVAAQPDGQLVVAGRMGDYDAFERFALVRYDARGTLDRRFGSGGRIVARVGGDGNAAAVAIERDGKIVVAGTSLVGSGAAIALARFTVRGRLDSSFGSHGNVVTRIGSWSEGRALARQEDGKLVVAGRAGTYDFGVVRYTNAGQLDATFGTGGKVVTNFGFVRDCTCSRPLEDSSEDALAVAIQPDGKVVAAGSSDALAYQGEKGCCLRDFALVRYNRDGSLDSTFGDDGKVLTHFSGGSSYAQAIAIQTDGKIVAAGGGAGAFVLARYTRQGVLDPTFGRGGKVTTNFA